MKRIPGIKPILLAVFLAVSCIAQGQYYYDDIRDARELGERMKVLVNNKVKTITASGYDERGLKTNEFNEWQEIDATANTLKITTRNGRQVTRKWYRFDEGFRLISITDSSTGIKANSVYSYDAAGRITAIKTTTQDSLSEFNETDLHQWLYNAAGRPEKMWRVVNDKDSSEYRFATDANGNVTDEQLYRRGISVDHIYYYYDAGNRLTDIVRYNKKAKQLLPDFMFEYDGQARVIQRISVLSTASRPDYLIWRYLYNDKGLKTKEALFNKQKELRGRIEYAFTFSP